MIRQTIIKLIQEATGEKPEDIRVERPEGKSYGDYSTNIALQLKKNPSELAQKLKSDLFEKVEAVNGFINFFISRDYLQKRVGEILRQGESFGGLKVGEGQKVNIEFISANPTGPLHIGNGRSAFAGDAIANVLEQDGYKVTREYLINDMATGRQVLALIDTVSQIEGRGIDYGREKGLPYLNEYLEEKISKIKIPKPEQIITEIQRDNRKFIEKKLKIKFDKWVSEERDLYGKGKIDKMLDWLKKNNLVYQKEGAWWVKTSDFGEEKDWVVVKGTGESTYLLSDIAYHKDKFDRGFNKVINIWGADHQAHVSKIKAAAKILGFKGNLDVLILQLVTLKGREKISKRTGKIIMLEELVDKIGLDVARWFYLQKSLNTHMEIDLTLAKEQSEKNPVFYVQYAHARICSILGKLKLKNKKSKVDYKLLNHPSELNLIEQLIRLPEVIEDTAKDYQVQRLPQYAMDLAAAFHQFYRDCKVLSEVEGLQKARLALVSATKIVLKNTLSLMGISAPEKM